MAQFTKKDKKEIDAIRHEVHMMGELFTLRQLFDRMEIYGDRICMVEKKKCHIIQHTVRDFRQDVTALGTALLHLGYKGKHLGIVSENSYAWVVAYFAVTCGVGVVAPIDKELTDELISYLFTKADCEAVFFSKMYRKTAKYHLEHDERCAKAICLNGDGDGENVLGFDQLIETGKKLVAEGDRSFIDAKVEKDDLAAIVFTSGTTGINKGVMLTHGNFAQNADGVLESIDPDQYSSISLLPMNHVYELSCNIFTALYMNCIVYINDSLKNFQQNLMLFKPDAMAIVPLVIDTIYTTIWKTAEETGRADVLKKA